MNLKFTAKPFLLRAQNWAKEQNITYIVTNVHAANSPMLEINKKFGFELIQCNEEKNFRRRASFTELSGLFRESHSSR